MIETISKTAPSTVSVTGRSTKDGPWCWQSKGARRLIRDSFDSSNNVASALGTYDALSEIASDAQAETFTTTHAWIQRISGVSVRTIQKHLKVFAELKLVAISTARFREPSTYTLFPFGNHCATDSKNTEPRSATGVSSEIADIRRISEKCSEEGNGEMKNCSAPVGAPVVDPSDASEGRKPILGTLKNPRPLPKAKAEVFDAAKALGIKRETASAFICYQNFNGWQMGGSRLIDWHKALGKFATSDRKRTGNLKFHGTDNTEFWGFVDAEKIEHATANAWIRSMDKHGWRLLNPANGRKEPIRDYRAALRAFVGSATNQTFEAIGLYD